MFNNPFSFKGRIRRLEYAASMFIYFLIFFSTAFLTTGITYGSQIFWIVFIILGWFLMAQGTKRCHDIGVGGIYQFIPFYFLWLLVEDGIPKKNQHGLNPKGLQGPEETGKIRQNEG